MVEPVDAPALRQPRARRTRERILAAAAAEFAVSGYHASSLSRVLQGSKVTKGALYFHFASKQDMAIAVMEGMEETYQEVAALARDRVVADPLRGAAQVSRDIQDLLSGSVVVRAGRRLAGEGVGGREWAAFPTRFWERVFEEYFAAAKEQGLVHDDVDPLALGRFVTDISAGSFLNSLAASEFADLAERVRHNWELMFRAVATPEWLAGWRAAGGMDAVLGEHLPPPGAAAGRPLL